LSFSLILRAASSSVCSRPSSAAFVIRGDPTSRSTSRYLLGEALANDDESGYGSVTLPKDGFLSTNLINFIILLNKFYKIKRILIDQI